MICGQKPPNPSHHPTKFCGFRHCGSGNIMVLVCHVILENHLIKALKLALTVYSKAHGMSYSHIRNLTIKVALTKIFAFVSSDSSLILVTLSCITNDEIYTKKTFVGPSKNGDRKQKEKKKRKAISKLFVLHANAKRSYRNN